MTWEIPGVVMGLAMTAAPIPAMIQVAVALILIATVLAVMDQSQEEVLNPAEAPSQGAVRSPAEVPKPAMVRSLVMVPKPAMAPSPAEVPKPAMVRSPAVIPKPEKKRSPVVQIKRLEAIQMKVSTKPRNLQKKPKNPKKPKKRMRTAAIAAEQAVIDLPDLMRQKVHKQSWKPYLPRFFRSQRMKRRPENRRTFMMT
ncbi:hypothetical protein [Enterocloster clostridioformis]|uniref:hypothetical protein n=1 Tax=Enterocloster clostridioformis TaxID=1531 RepID=UPI001FAB8264|nr:hypothetical protein [Enterocloster clostridioformis]